MAHEHTEVSTEKAVADVLDYTHALTGLGGSAIILILIPLFSKMIIAKIREGLVVKSEITSKDGEYIFSKKDEIPSPPDMTNFITEHDLNEYKETQTAINEKTRKNEADLFDKNNKLSQRVTAVETTVKIMRETNP